MPGPSPIVKARIKPELHAQFEALRLAQGLSESDLLKRAITNELANASRPAGAGTLRAGAAPAGDDEARMTRLTIRLPSFVRQAATARAALRGFKVSPWVSALVQSHVSASPVLTDIELQAVEAANRELFAIGRNINQMAHAINAEKQIKDFVSPHSVNLSKLREVSDQINSLRESIRGLVRASRNAWRGE